MRMYFAGVGAALAAVFVIAASRPGMASTMIGPQDTSVDWAQEFCLTDCTSTRTSSPISQIDVIMSTASTNAGITFTGISPVFSDIGETTLVNPTATTTLGANESTIQLQFAG